MTPEIIIQKPEDFTPIDIDVETGLKKNPYKWTVTGKTGESRYHTNYDYEVQVSTTKSRNGEAAEQIVPVYQYLRAKDRDGMIPVRKHFMKHIQPFGYKKKIQFVVPSNVFKEEKQKNGAGRPPDKKK
jgi:hypothetical protein